MALQAKNEALCGTGFFTNIAQYKCTETGDISDEGKARALSSTEETSMESLMDKLGMSNVDFVTDENGKNKGDQGQSRRKTSPTQSTK